MRVPLAEKAKRIMAILDELYEVRRSRSITSIPFTLLVAVVLSAQTTDKKVNQVTPRCSRSRRTPAGDGARCPSSEIRALIREVGLAPQKAKALKALARAAGRASTAAQVPADFEALEALPGVGHKTASVVMAQAFGMPAFPVDTHIHRLAARWGLSDGKTVEHDRARSQAPLPRGALEHAAPADHLLRSRALSGALSRSEACPICSWAATKKRIDEERRMNDQARQRSKKKAKPKVKARA